MRKRYGSATEADPKSEVRKTTVELTLSHEPTRIASDSSMLYDVIPMRKEKFCCGNGPRTAPSVQHLLHFQDAEPDAVAVSHETSPASSDCMSSVTGVLPARPVLVNVTASVFL